MEFLQRYWLQARDFLGEVAPSTRWLIGCLLVILVLSGWLVMQYVAEPELISITQFAGDRQAEATARLHAAGIEVRNDGGQMWVPAGRYDEALVILVNGELLAADTTAAFDQMVMRQSPWQSSAQNAQAFLLAKQKVLGQIISKMAGVRSASVMLSMPQRQGFGASHTQPSASVNVVMGGRGRVDKGLVEAIGGLVSGAIAEMRPQDVVVVDANRGRQFTVKSGDDLLAGETFDLMRQLEHRYKEKIASTLGYIPNLIVEVNARLDPIHSKRVEEFDYEKTEPLKTEFTRETERREMARAGEPGARSNTGLDIEGGGSSGGLETTSENRNEYANKNMTRRVQMTEVGHHAKRIDVTVNVPRPYFVGVFMQGKPEDTEPPDDATLKPVIDAQLATIRAQVEPLVKTEQEDGEVRVHMIPDRNELMALAGIAGIAPASGGVGAVFDSQWVKPVGLAMLALMSVGIMLGMVKKATKEQELPSIEELAGVPTVLAGDDDLLGEAGESDGSLDAQELDDDEVAVRQVIDEISEMIKSDPVEAVQLMNRWMRTEE